MGTIQNGSFYSSYLGDQIDLLLAAMAQANPLPSGTDWVAFIDDCRAAQAGAEAAAAAAASWSSNPPYIGANGNWYVYDTQTEQFADSGVPAQGPQGEPGISPEVTIAQIAGGHSVTITDAEHPGGQTFNVMDGQMSATTYDPSGTVAAAGGIPDYVADQITQGTAIFRGSFATKAALDAVAWQTSNPSAPYYVSNNDYAYVEDDETQNDECWRYLYVTGTGWQPQIRINESPLTTAQLAALNSGATSTNIASIATKQPQITTASVSLTTTWTGAGPYTQTISVTGSTANSKIDLQPTAAQLQQLIDDGVQALYISNNNGTLTATALGAAPTAAMTIQCTLTEVTA